MSTRRLIITALVCGMAILLAGGIFLVRVAQDQANNTVTVHRVGDVVRVGQVAVTVTRVSERADAIEVGVEIDATGATLAQSTDAEEPWSLLVRTPRPRRDATGTPCRGLAIASGAKLACTVAFEPGDGTAFLSFDLAGSGARWRLD